MVTLRCACTLVLLLLGTLLPAVAAARVKVEVDRDPVVADESFAITFTADSTDASEPDFSPLERDFDILQRSSQTSLQIINGRPASRQSWVLNVIAKHAGMVQVPAIAFGNDRSDPLQLDVRPGTQGPGADNDVFIVMEATPQPAYVQAQILVSVRLYMGLQAANATLSDLQATGAIVEKLGENRRGEEVRNGRRYEVYERRYAVFAERSGTVTLSPVEFAGELLGRGFFSRYKRTASEPMDLTIRPAPPDVIPWLPASDLTLTEQWPEDPPVFHAGEPVTRTLTLTAKGLTAAQLPPLSGASVADFKQYVDQPQLDDRVADDGVTGVRVEKVAFLPTQSGHYTLPAIEVQWWDTAKAGFEVARVPEREVDVLPGAVAQSPAPAPATTGTAPVAASPVAPGLATKTAPAREAWPWIAATATLALAWLLTLSLWWWSSRRRSAGEREPEPFEPPGLTSARGQLQAACTRDDPAAAQRALVAWAQARWPGAEAGAWRELRKSAGSALARELELLDRALYGRGSASWSGQALWKAFCAAEPRPAPRRRRAPVLEPLHP